MLVGRSLTHAGVTRHSIELIADISAPAGPAIDRGLQLGHARFTNLVGERSLVGEHSLVQIARAPVPAGCTTR